MSVTKRCFSVNVKVEEPKMFNVIMYNDDVTTFDFVEYLLETIFDKTSEQASDLANKINETGRQIVGTYHQDSAVLRTSEAIRYARSNNFPLKVEVEEA